MQVNRKRQQSLAIRWILMAVREKKGRADAQKLADELVAAYNREGAAVSRRENVHRMADANKAFAHFALVIANNTRAAVSRRDRGFFYAPMSNRRQKTYADIGV